MPTPSKRSLRLKRVAKGALRQAEAAAKRSEAWSEDHLRTWRNILDRAVKHRLAVLSAYLELRSKRHAARECVLVD